MAINPESTSEKERSITPNDSPNASNSIVVADPVSDKAASTPSPPPPAAGAPAKDGWPSDPDNPHNWPQAKKAFHTFIPAFTAFICTLGSSIYTPGRESLIHDFGVSEEVSLLPYVLYVLGLGFGPLVSSPISETLGRRGVYTVTLSIFALFVLGSGFSKNIASLVICRFFAGFFGSAGLGIGGATMADVWLPAQRAVPMALYVFTPFLGPAIGPLVGGFAAARFSWRWTEWVLLFFTAACLGSMVFMKETYKPAILRARAKRKGIAGPPRPERTFIQAAMFFIRSTLSRPLHMALVEPIVGLFTLYVGVNFGILYGFFAGVPLVFKEKYGFDIRPTSLTFISLGVGAGLGAVIIIIFAKTLFKNRVVASIKAGRGGKVPPELRLYPAMIGGVCLTVSLFWFAWSTQAAVHWICPVIAEAVYGLGNFLVFMSCSLYLVDFYGPMYGASAMAGNTLIRYTIGAVFPLFIEHMFKNLGFGWAVSIFGFISLALAAVPFAFFKWGPALRKSSKYATSN